MDNEQAIKEAISEMLAMSVQVKKVEDIDNKKIVLFTTGSETGESEFTRGPNHKLKINSAGHGTNLVRYRIMETNRGQYVRFLGKNEDGVSTITVFVEEEKYHLSILPGQYFISYVPLAKTTKISFPSGSVWYDKDNKEIARINISKDYIM
ncbi:hypothetical protein [Cohnella silvisoli]|uniref:DUF1934 domain-containing protein n=1 Tax=Cohnella silvisoli TaxID=2873699 RepID=A0ABV1L0Z0_9BACL|nr:hypothetical protein [Cohnella silvisoli]MCD9025339.1 hypothetical protein [Cohnella silvisoli]